MSLHAASRTAVHWVYRLYAEDGQLLYIGTSHEPETRLKYHSWEKPWWWAVARHELTEYPDRLSALVAEGDAIEAEQPLCNWSWEKRREHPGLTASSLWHRHVNELLLAGGAK